MSATANQERPQAIAQLEHAGRSHAARPSLRLALIALGIVGVFRLLSQLLLYRDGFIALTADDFGRTIVAAEWALDPAPIWSNFWLPFHAYLFGSALMALPELMIVPRTLMVLIGLCAIVLIYALATGLFASRTAGLVAALLLAASPPHVWLSSVPLAEGISSALILACGAAFVAFLRQSRDRWLWLSACALLLATGFRYEAWMAAMPFSATLAAMAALRLWRRRPLAGALSLTAAAALPWVFPAIWLAGNYVETGSFVAFKEFVHAYSAMWWGNNPSYGRYPQAWLRIDPAATLLVLPALALCLAMARGAAARWYIGFILTTFAIFAFLHGGQAEPLVTSDRYHAQFLFLAYPLVAGGLVLATGALPRRWAAPALAAACALIVASQLVITHRVQNDPVADGVPAGRALREIRTAGEPGPALIEFEYWQSLGLTVGANDVRGLYFDRQPNLERTTQSLLLESPERVRGCLVSNRIAYVVLRTPELQARAEEALGLTPLRELEGGYKIYGVPPAGPDEALGSTPCPLASHSST